MAAWQGDAAGLIGWLGERLQGAGLPANQGSWGLPLPVSPHWASAMQALRVALPVVTALLLFAELLAARARRLPGERTRRRLAVVLAAVAFGAWFDFGVGGTSFHRAEFFHHYLGPKYHAELGYTGLYECVAAAERASGRGDRVARRTLRDLHDGTLRRAAAPDVAARIEACPARFSPDRWAAFTADVGALRGLVGDRLWESTQKDHGYNAPPLWTLVGVTVAALGPPSEQLFGGLALLDLGLLLGAFVLLFRAFGWRVGVVAAVWWGCAFPSGYFWVGGALLRHDWLFLVVAALCLARWRRFALAGAALAAASLLRGFPLLLFGGAALVVAFTAAARRRAARAPVATSADATPGPPPGRTSERPGRALAAGWLAALHPDHRRFLAGALLAGSALFAASVAATGPGSYPAFVERTLVVHERTPRTDDLGLEVLLVHTREGRMQRTRDDDADDPFAAWAAGRIERAREIRALHWALTLAVLAWTAWALRGTRRLWVGMALSVPLVVSALDLTGYYYSLLLILAVLVALRPALGPPLLVSSAGSQVLAAPEASPFRFIDDRYAALSWLFVASSLLALYGLSRPLVGRRARQPAGAPPLPIPPAGRAAPPHAAP